ncbi:MAG: hypothetical protein RIE53_08885 [Rhodothermales bacterium]
MPDIQLHEVDPRQFSAAHGSTVWAQGRGHRHRIATIRADVVVSG